MLRKLCCNPVFATSSWVIRRSDAVAGAARQQTHSQKRYFLLQIGHTGRTHRTCVAFDRALLTSAAEGEACTAGKPARRLFLYSKDNCPLCDGLKEKVQGLIDRAEFMPSALSGIVLEVRDITTVKEWWDAYSLTIPVLTFADAEGNNEVKVPRPSPRISADRLQAHLEKAMASAEDSEQ